MNVETPRDLFEYELVGLYSTEHELIDLLDDLADESTIDALDTKEDLGTKEAFTKTLLEHREQTQTHVERLESVFEAIGRQPNRRDGTVLEGVVSEKDRFSNIILNDELRCPFFAAQAMTVERIEITAYEALLDLAEKLDLGDAVIEPLETNLSEERSVFEEFERFSDELQERAIA